MTLAAFEIGKTYAGNSICDSNSWDQLTVAKRTAKTITTGEGKVLRINVWNDEECVKPNGSYSMALIIGAKRLVIEHDEDCGAWGTMPGGVTYIGERRTCTCGKAVTA